MKIVSAAAFIGIGYIMKDRLDKRPVPYRPYSSYSQYKNTDRQSLAGRIKTHVSDVIANKLEKIFFGDPRDIKFNEKSCLFYSKADAQDALDRMFEICNRYGKVTVRDLKDFREHNCYYGDKFNYTDMLRVWHMEDIRKAKVVYTRDGRWKLEIGQPIYEYCADRNSISNSYPGELKDAYFNTEREAKDYIDEVQDSIGKYGVYTVFDYNSKTQDGYIEKYPDHQYGWDDIGLFDEGCIFEDVNIETDDPVWTVEMPDAVYLKKEKRELWI